MKKFIHLILLFFAVLPDTKVKASHAAGAEIIYEWISDSTYRIYAHFYRDCSGIPEPTSFSLCIHNSCNPTWDTNIILNKTLILPGGAYNGEEIYFGCPSNPSTCDGGTLPGFRGWWYAGVYTFPYKCNSWTMGHAESARNYVANLPGGGNLYVEATFDNLHAQGNSSAYFTVPPSPDVCDDVLSTYNAGALDANNDSLVFELIDPRSGSDCYPTSLSFGSAYPLSSYMGGSSFSFSSTTGQLNFIPSATGQVAIAERVNEYRYVPGSGWLKISSVMRDMEIVVLPCTNKLPTLSTNTDIIRGASFSGGTLNACAATPFNFCFDVTSSDTNAVLVPTDNGRVFSSLTKPSTTYSHVYTDSIRGCVSWTPGYTDTGLKIFCVSIKDSGCTGLAIAHSNVYSIPIYVYPSVKASISKKSICRGDSVVLGVSGGGSFMWSVVPGGSLSSSLSCTSCSSPVAKPVFTTSYVVSNGSIATCKNRDTVTVSVTPMPAKPIITTDSVICASDSLKLTAIESTTGVTYKWTGPSGYVSTMANPIIPIPNAGKYKLVVAEGSCMVADSFNLRVETVSPSPTVYITTVPPGDKYTTGDYVLFTANTTGTVPSTTYQWEKNGVVIAGATNSKYLTNAVSAHDIVGVVVRNNMPCSVVDSAVGSTFPLDVRGVNNPNVIKVFPNPTGGDLTISGNLATNEAEIQICDITGQIVYREHVIVNKGYINRELHFGSSLANGYYILRISTANKVENLNFIVNR